MAASIAVFERVRGGSRLGAALGRYGGVTWDLSQPKQPAFLDSNWNLERREGFVHSVIDSMLPVVSGHGEDS